jgi:hypothetical protein
MHTFRGIRISLALSVNDTEHRTSLVASVPPVSLLLLLLLLFSMH